MCELSIEEKKKLLKNYYRVGDYVKLDGEVSKIDQILFEKIENRFGKSVIRPYALLSNGRKFIDEGNITISPKILKACGFIEVDNVYEHSFPSRCKICIKFKSNNLIDYAHLCEGLDFNEIEDRSTSISILCCLQWYIRAKFNEELSVNIELLNEAFREQE